jgi:methyl coenzyme M reductase alpha subunit
MQFIIELVIRLLTKMMEKKEYGKIAQEVLEKKGIKSVSEILKKYPKIANSLKNMKESKTLENTLKYIGKKANQNTWELLKRTLLESIRSIEHMLLPAEVKQLY